jgi:hypothetical protein
MSSPFYGKTGGKNHAIDGRTIMIVVRLFGGLGNQMFQYALGRHLSWHRKTELLMDTSYFDYRSTTPQFTPRQFELDIFNIEAKVASSQELRGLPYFTNSIIHRGVHKIKKIFNLYYFLDSCEYISEKEPFHFDEKVLNVGRNAYLVGHWQNPRYFIEISDMIRSDFTFSVPFSEKTRTMATAIREGMSVCINIRRGDFVRNSVHGVLGLDYFYAAIKLIKERTNNCHFYIFSDEIGWCQENLRINSGHTFVTHEYAGNKFAEYLYLMTQCKHFVIPNSTFGWWAAWLADYPQKIIIAPKRWFAQADFDTTELIPQGWERL